MLPLDWGPVYRLGRVVLTRKVRERFSDDAVATALLRHARKAWRNNTPRPPTGPLRSRPPGYRLLSACQLGAGPCLWIITEASGDLTTVLLPEDYHSGRL
jgi:hypothetical protein